MRIKSLSLEHIGPFIEANMTFMAEDETKPPVILITGENGTGKSIILDAIRGMFGPDFARLDRDIRRSSANHRSTIHFTLTMDECSYHYFSGNIREEHILSRRFILKTEFGYGVPSRDDYDITSIPNKVKRNQAGDVPNWIVDYWPSLAPGDSYKINALQRPDHQSFLKGSLQGQRTKANITNLISHFDYLRDSRDPTEKVLGEQLYEILERIIEHSLLDGGKLSHVARTTYEPIVIQNGQEVGLANLSSGNAYLIQNMVGLLGTMYSSHFLRQAPLSELCQTPGVLLIDEAENQLHPKWQKRFIRSILDIFPNLQIIATTHSPFIISSVPNARLFVCKSQVDHCVVVDETATYSNKPVDEILMSPLFEATQPFNAEITQLIEARAQAIKGGDIATREAVESKLKAINPEYFSYFLDSLKFF